MAKKHLLELQNELYNTIGKELENLEIEVNSATKAGMIDPETVELAISRIRKISTKIQTLGSGLSMAINYPNDFIRGYNSLNNMVSLLYKTIDGVREEDPNSHLIKEYEATLAVNLSTLLIYEYVKERRDLPKSKKNLSKWIRKKWYRPGNRFYPFSDIWESLKELKSFIDENL